MRRIVLALAIIVILGVCLFLVPGCLPRGQKLLLLEVVKGNEIVLATNFDADDASTVSEIWDAAGEVPFTTSAVGPSLLASGDDPMTAVVAGPVEIRITHVSEIQSSAVLSDVTLVRSSTTADDWRLPVREIVRAKEAAGL